MNSLPKTVTRQRRGCDLNRGPTAPESSTLPTRLLSQPLVVSRPPDSPTNSAGSDGGLMFCCCFFFSALSVRPIISTSTRPIFAAFAVLVELRLWMNDLKLVLRSLIGRCRGNQFCGPNPDPIHTTRLVGDGKAKKIGSVDSLVQDSEGKYR